MSPAPQGNLEVERYIGSYLISQRIPPNVKASSGSKRYQNHHVKPKNTETEKVRNFNKYCFPQREHHVGGPPRYSMPPGQIPLPVECQGYGNNHYGGKHNPGGSGWAGVPLISMTSGNHRRNKKVPSTTNQVQKYPHKQTQHNNYVKVKETEDNIQSDMDRSPLTRLAIHTQGAPLIQSGRYANNNRCRNNFGRDPSSRVYRGDSARWDGAKDTKVAAGTQIKEQGCGNNDSSSVASDESSGNSENSLPRIIKPRKRRKKDRKPITGASSVAVPTTESHQYPHESDQNGESSKLTTFLPLCFEPKSTNANENDAPDLLSENTHISPVEEKQIEDLIDPLTSADEFPFGNLLDDEEDNHSELSSCAPATLCQCRYCDPSGVIWDVDQRCYSPFLTPPSPTDGNLHFNNSLPLSFDSFNHIAKSYNRQVAVVDPPITPPSSYSFSGDLGSLLRRSWSDPSSYKKPENRQAQISSEAEREKFNSRPSSPLGLQVSSEIVTSPNGHRDIEIKFYSSTHSESSKGKISASERDQIDRCFVVEE